MNRRWIPFVATAALLAACSDEPTPPTVSPLRPGQPAFATSSIANQNSYEQCQDGNPGPTDCNWVNGVLNATHSVYNEGDVIAQKVILNGASVSTTDAHTLTITYGFQKSSSVTNANYDFQARWDATLQGHANPCLDTGNQMKPFCASGALKGTLASDHVDFPAPTAGNSIGLPAFDLAKLQLAFGRFAGPRSLVIYGGKFPTDGSAISSVTYNVTSSSIEATVTYKFYATSSDVLLLWGMHFARGVDWRDGPAPAINGAAGQSGAPFHTVLVTLDGVNQGSMSLNVMGDVVLSPSATLSISPSGVNEIGKSHTITATVMAATDAGVPPAPAANVLVTFTKDPSSTAGSFVGGVSTCTTNASGQCTVSITSTQVGTMLVNALATVTVSGQQLQLTTNGAGGSSGPVTKRWVDASIAITPLAATNGISEPHTWTITVTALPDGAVNPGGPTVAFNSITPSLSSSPDGGSSTTCNAPTVDATGNVATCTVTITSNTAGTFTLNASANITITGAEGSAVLNRDTDPSTTTIPAGPSGSVPATKTYVDGTLTWLKNDGNGNPLGGATFTVCRTQNWSSATSSYANVSPAVCQDVTDNQGQSGYTGQDTDANAGKFTLQHLVLGTYTVKEKTAPASYALDPSTQTAQLSTASLPGSASASLNGTPFVDPQPTATITITPASATNGITQPHTMNITVTAIPNGGSGTVAFSSVTPTIVSGPSTLTLVSGTPAPGQYSTTCSQPSVDQNGTVATCSVTINSAVTGTYSVKASAVLTVAGVQVNVSTDGQNGNSGPAAKTYVDGTLTWVKKDGSGNLLGGATFTVCLVGTPPCFSVTDNGATDKDPVLGQFKLTGLVLGTYSVTETAAPPGYSLDPNPQQATLSVPTNASPNANTAALANAFVDLKPSAKISIAQSATNGITVPHTFTVTLSKNTGNGTFVAAAGEHVNVTLTNGGGASYVVDAASSTCDDAGANTDSNGQCTIKFVSNTAGTVTGHASANLTVGGVALSVQTDGASPNSGDAVKTYVDGTLTWIKVDGSNGNALLGGATFKACLTGGSCITVADNDPTDQDPTVGKFKLTGLVLGTWTVTETIPPTGYTLDPNPQQATLTTTSTSNATFTFVDSPAGRGLMAPTQTTCEQFASGSNIAEPSLSAGFKGQTISVVSPGVVFYYATLPVQSSSGNMSVTVRQRNTTGSPPVAAGYPLMTTANGQAYVLSYINGSCNNVATFSGDFSNAATISGSFPAQANVQYIVQIKLSPNSLVGDKVDKTKLPVSYLFDSSLGGLAGPFLSGASIPLVGK